MPPKDSAPTPAAAPTSELPPVPPSPILGAPPMPASAMRPRPQRTEFRSVFDKPSHQQSAEQKAEAIQRALAECLRRCHQATEQIEQILTGLSDEERAAWPPSPSVQTADAAAAASEIKALIRKFSA